jgi:peptide/nickel transport system substrate-binding protein
MGRMQRTLAAGGATATLLFATGASVSYYEEALPSTMNPLFARTMVDWRSHELVFDRLFYRSPLDNSMKSRLVESHTAIDGGRQIQLKLKSGIKWHDGKPLTADDVCFTIDAMLNSSTPSPNAKAYRESIEDCDADTKNATVTITFQRAYHNPRERLSMHVLPKHLFSSNAVTPDLDFSSHPIGTGPMKANKGRSGVAFTAFPNVHQMPKISEMKLTEGIDPMVQVRTLLNGGVNGLITVAPSLRADVAQSDVAALKLYDLRSWWFVALNTNRGSLKDKRVRQALDWSLDRTELRTLIGGGTANEATAACEFISGPFVSASAYYNRQIRPKDRADRAKAAEIMKSAGATQVAGRWNLNGAPLQYKIGMNAPLEAEAPDLLNQIGNQLFESGFDRVVNKVTADDWTRKAVTGGMTDFDMLIGKWSFGLVEDVNPIFQTRANGQGSSNIFGYSNSEVDKLLRDWEAARTDTDAQNAYHALHAKLAEEVPYLFLWKLDTRSAWLNTVRNNNISPYYYFTEFSSWKAD